jgi:hypothetical protein
MRLLCKEYMTDFLFFNAITILEKRKTLLMTREYSEYFQTKNWNIKLILKIYSE